MNIALVGVDKRTVEILNLTKLMSLPIEITAYPYSVYTELKEIIPTIKNVDGILFAGNFPYVLSVNEIDKSIPTAFLEFDETGIMKLMASLPFHQVPKAISIDSVQGAVVKHVYRELNFPLTEVSAVQRSKSLTVEDIAKFHIYNYRKNPETSILTCLFSVNKYLEDQNYPCTLINHTYFSVLKGVNKIINAINFKNSSGNHPAVVIIKIDKCEKKKPEQNEFRSQRFLYKYFDYLLDFQEQLQSFVFNRGSENYYLISTRNLIEEYTNNYQDFPLLYDVFVKFGFTISVGIGYGMNPINAFTNATEALEIAIKTGNTVKVLTESGQVISPVDQKDSTYNIKKFDEKIIRFSEKSGITAENISKIFTILERQGSNHLTAYDLSKALGTTTRSGNRLIGKLFQAGYAKESGIEQPAKGRPRRVYELQFESPLDC
ncbi:MAG: hypothetical protein L3J57_05235 [Desulfuromusa sp.]|nr:hypothetical protein [Desulfuromusa sp.]